MLFLSGSLVLCGDIDDAVCVDIEGHFDLRRASLRRENTVQAELSESLIVPRKLPLSLYDMDIHSGLVVGRGREDLGGPGRDGGIPLDERSRHAAERLDGKRQRGHIQEKDIARSLISRELSALHRRAESHALVRVQGLGGLLSGDPLHLLLHHGHTGGAADQKDLGELRGRESGVLQGVLHGDRRPLREIRSELLELRPA